MTDTPVPYSLSGSRLTPKPSSASFQSPYSARRHSVSSSILLIIKSAIRARCSAMLLRSSVASTQFLPVIL